jgi:hypothetical protein
MSAKDGLEVYLYTHNKIQLLSLYRLKLGAHDMSNAPLALELNMSWCTPNDYDSNSYKLAVIIC